MRATRVRWACAASHNDAKIGLTSALDSSAGGARASKTGRTGPEKSLHERPLLEGAATLLNGINGREAANFLAAVCIAATINYWL